MRQLTKQQKTFLDKWYQQHKDKLTIFNVMDTLSLEDFEKLEQMHDTEILYQNINNYITDKI
jgi:hypothetical protein